MVILIVDDSKIARHVLKKLLAEIGYKDVHEASNGREALSFVEANKVDLIISDWIMPSLDGLGLVTALQTTRARRVPVLVISSESDLGRVVQIMQAGARAYLVKPFTAEQLRAKIDEMKRMESLAQESARTSTLAGLIAEIGFPELIQFLSAGRMNGTLRISAGARQGAIEFRDGDVRGSTFEGREGDEAFFGLADLTDGRFRFERLKDPAPSVMGTPTLTLLMEAMRRRDEQFGKT